MMSFKESGWRKNGPIEGWRWPAPFFLLLFGALLSLTGCLGLLTGNDDETAVPTSPYSGPVEFSCNQACSDRGQCGTAVDQTDRVFMSTISPVVDGHDQLIVPGTRGLILDTITRTLVTASTDTSFTHPFHLVQVDGSSQIGWVAQWCVAPVN